MVVAPSDVIRVTLAVLALPPLGLWTSVQHSGEGFPMQGSFTMRSLVSRPTLVQIGFDSWICFANFCQQWHVGKAWHGHSGPWKAS